MSQLVGKLVKWELSGRGRGTIQRGIALMHIPPGTSNREAFRELREEYPDLRLRKSHCRFGWETHTTPRYFVVSKKLMPGRVWPVHVLYAPNENDLVPVSQES